MRQRIIFSALLSGVLSGLMTLWISWMSLGPGPDLLGAWLRAWPSAWPVAGAISFGLAPTMLRLSHRIDSWLVAHI